jgi:predicted protein tyrosine phosphatase
MPIKHVLFTSQKAAEAKASWSDWAVISINSSGTSTQLKGGWKDVLSLEFDDIVDYEENAKLFSEAQARQIIEFVMRCNAEETEGLLVHCNAGVCRSAAVAKWVSEKYGLGFPLDYDKHNKHVYRVLKEENQLVGFYKVR